MKTKFLAISDYLTADNVLVLQFGAEDKEFCKSAGFDPGLKVILSFRGRRVSCIAGFDLRDDFGGTVEALECEFPRDGTIHVVKEMLHYVSDVSSLASTFDVQECREVLGTLNRRGVLPDSLRELLAETDNTQLRKVLFQWGAMPHLAIFRVGSREPLYDQGSTSLDNLTMVFLWIPVQEASQVELSAVELSPFRYHLL